MRSLREISLEEARSQAEKLRSRIAVNTDGITALAKQIKEDSDTLRVLERFIAAGSTRAAEASPRSSRPKNPDRREVSEKALEIIRAARKPLSRRDLYERLTEAGVTINGKDPEMVLGTMLYRDDRIVRLRGYGYWPKEEPFDAAFYLPEHESVIGATDTSLES